MTSWCSSPFTRNVSAPTRWFEAHHRLFRRVPGLNATAASPTTRRWDKLVREFSLMPKLPDGNLETAAPKHPARPTTCPQHLVEALGTTGAGLAGALGCDSDRARSRPLLGYEH